MPHTALSSTTPATGDNGDNGDDWLFGESGPDALDGGSGQLDFCDGGTGMVGNRPEDDSTTGG